MPKAERGSAKDIANRMKAKGLQKLKYYCQMCQKQCRDENGFKCHLTSDSHLRNMKHFCSNSSGMLDEFSAQFEKNYIDTLYRRHRTKRMNANSVYQEVIQDKEHIHMNATKWATLTDFVQYLGKMSKCVVEETERGWYVTYIERDPVILAQQENYKQRVEAEKKEEQKVAKRMEIQRIEAAKLMDRAGVGVDIVPSNLKRSADDAPIAITLGGNNINDKRKNSKKKMTKKKKSVFGNDEDDENDNDDLEARLLAEVNKPIHSSIEKKRKNDDDLGHGVESKSGNDFHEQKRKRGIHDIPPKHGIGRSSEMNDSNSSSKHKKYDNDDDDDDLLDIRKKHWIRKDILTRIISKKVKKGRYYKRKCIILKIYDKYTAKVELLDSGPNADDGGDIIEVDQDDLETVIPKVGKKVMILNGRGRGMVAELISLDDKKYRGSLQLLDSDTILKKVDYNDFSKVILE